MGTMVETRDTAESVSGETDKIINEYREKIMQSLEHECRRLRERAEHESRSIIAQAYQEVDTITAKSHQEAHQ